MQIPEHKGSRSRSSIPPVVEEPDGLLPVAGIGRLVTPGQAIPLAEHDLGDRAAPDVAIEARGRRVAEETRSMPAMRRMPTRRAAVTA